VCVILCTVFRLIVVVFCVMCVVCVLCLVVVPLPSGKNPFAVKINNNNTAKARKERNPAVV
jgi:type IV secretory pathway component VirB8